MEPAYELLRASAPAGADADLRVQARSHPDAATAPFRSRSYRAPLALVAWGQTRLGVDLEQIAPTERRFAESICTPQERSLLGARLDEDETVTSLWSSKEALAKALGDALAYDPRRLESPLLWVDGASGSWRARRLTPAAGYVAWLVWREPDPSRLPSTPAGGPPGALAPSVPTGSGSTSGRDTSRAAPAR